MYICTQPVGWFRSAAPYVWVSSRPIGFALVDAVEVVDVDAEVMVDRRRVGGALEEVELLLADLEPEHGVPRNFAVGIRSIPNSCS